MNTVHGDSFIVKRNTEGRVFRITHERSGIIVSFKRSESYSDCVNKWNEFLHSIDSEKQTITSENSSFGLTWCPLTGTVHTCGSWNKDFYLIKASINRIAVSSRGAYTRGRYGWWSPKTVKKHISTPLNRMGMIKKYREYKTPYDVYIRDRIGVSNGETNIRNVKRSATRKLKSVSPEEQSFFQMILSAKKLSDIYKTKASA
jgi:hypothetical protein